MPTKQEDRVKTKQGWRQGAVVNIKTILGMSKALVLVITSPRMFQLVSTHDKLVKNMHQLVVCRHAHGVVDVVPGRPPVIKIWNTSNEPLTVAEWMIVMQCTAYSTTMFSPAGNAVNAIELFKKQKWKKPKIGTTLWRDRRKSHEKDNLLVWSGQIKWKIHEMEITVHRHDEQVCVQVKQRPEENFPSKTSYSTESAGFPTYSRIVVSRRATATSVEKRQNKADAKDWQSESGNNITDVSIRFCFLKKWFFVQWRPSSSQ